MNEQTARELLMDYLYDEISAADKKKLEAYLADHPELQKELGELRETQSVLQQMPEVEPEKKLAVVEPRERSFTDWLNDARVLFPHSVWGKTALATAACLVLLLVAAAVVNLNIQSNQAGFSISFDDAVQPKPTGLSEAQTEAIVQQITRKNAAILTEYADMLNKHNRQQLQQVVEYFERQRLNDLQLIDQALNQYQEKTENKLQQTNQVLGEVLQTVASNNQQ